MIRDFVNNQVSNTKQLVISTKEIVSNTNEVVRHKLTQYYDDLSVFTCPKIEFVKVKLVEGKEFMIVQFENTMMNGSKANEKIKEYVLEGYKVISLKNSEIKTLLDNSKIELLRYLLKNKNLLRDLIESKKDSLIQSYAEYKEGSESVQNIEKAVVDCLQKMLTMLEVARDQVKVSKDQAKDMTMDKYNVLKE